MRKVDEENSDITSECEVRHIFGRAQPAGSDQHILIVTQTPAIVPKSCAVRSTAIGNQPGSEGFKEKLILQSPGHGDTRIRCI